MAWSKRHGEILQTFLSRLDDAQIRFFIIRNYEGLPFFNNSKDVDIVLKHGTALNAEKILKDVFRTYNLCYYYRVRIEESLLCRAVSSDGYFAIHIDLMNGYIESLLHPLQRIALFATNGSWQVCLDISIR